MDFEIINLLEEKINFPNTTCINTSENIYEYIKKVSSSTSRETVRKKLERFRKGIYYASWGHTNPFFIKKAQQDIANKTSSFATELFYLHRLMYNYLCNESHNYLTFTPLECDLISYSQTQFKWNIPIRFMPIFLSYILAADSTMSSKKAFSFKDFFSTLEDYLPQAISLFADEYEDFDKYNINKLFVCWLNHYLGRQYFLTLESIYKEYAKTPEQLKSLQNCFSPITYSLLNCSIRPRLAPIYSHIILYRCKEYLDSKLKEHNLTSASINLLYPHEDNWSINDEKNFVFNITSDMVKLWIDNFHFINNYLRENYKPTPYRIAVIDFKEFHSEYLKRKDEMKKYSSKEILSEKLFSFFNTTYYNPAIENAILTHSLAFNKKSVQLHIDEFASILINHNTAVMKSFHSFSVMVKNASGLHPEKYNTLKVNEDYLNNLKKAIKEEKKKLKSEIQAALKELPYIIKFYNPGYIQELQLRLSTFTEEELLPLNDFLHSYDQKSL